MWMGCGNSGLKVKCNGAHAPATVCIESRCGGKLKNMVVLMRNWEIMSAWPTSDSIPKSV